MLTNCRELKLAGKEEVSKGKYESRCSLEGGTTGDPTKAQNMGNTQGMSLHRGHLLGTSSPGFSGMLKTNPRRAVGALYLDVSMISFPPSW